MLKAAGGTGVGAGSGAVGGRGCAGAGTARASDEVAEERLLEMHAEEDGETKTWNHRKSYRSRSKCE